MTSQPLTQESVRHQVSPLSSLSTIRPWCALTLLHLEGHALVLLCLVGCVLAILCLAALSSGRPKSASTALPPPSSPTRPGSPILTDSSSEGSSTAENHASRWTDKKLANRRQRRVIAIGMLPDDVLLAIFDFCADEDPHEKREIEAWQPLVHVCRRWRSVAFGSPNRLNLRLVCTAKTPARDTLDVWPPLPLLIRDRADVEEGLGNIIAVLERSDRVHVVDLEDVSSSDLEKLSAAMQEPFPELTRLELSSRGEVVLPDSFLGGFTPRLQFFHLFGISFPSLPKLLLSTTHLVNLYIWNTPHSGYISPEAMFTALSVLTSLEELILEFQSPRSLPEQTTRHPPPLTRSVLSVLRYFRFKGDSEYLDDLVAHVDAPRLNDLYLIFFSQIVFDTQQLIQFISRTPRLKALEKAHVIFAGGAATVKFSSLTSGDGLLHVGISCRELDWQVSSLEQVCTSCLPPLSTLEHLYIYEDTYWQAHRQDNVDNALWLELLHPFRAVKKLYLSEEFAQRIAPALKELVGARTTEVLPALQNIFLQGLRPSGPIHEGIQQFVAARQVTNHPIAVSPWDRRQDKVPRGLWLANAYDFFPH